MTKHENFNDLNVIYADRVNELLTLYPDTLKAIKTNFSENYNTYSDYFKSYTFWKVFYNKMYDENIAVITNPIDYQILYTISLILRQEHLINWTRCKLFETNNCQDLYVSISCDVDINKTFSIKIERIKIWLYYCSHVSISTDFQIDYKRFYIDDYMLKYIPEIKKFIIGVSNE